jgi:hypothetical protein
MGPRSGLNDVEGRKIYFLYRMSNPGHLVRSPSLYLLNRVYTYICFLIRQGGIAKSVVCFTTTFTLSMKASTGVSLEMEDKIVST